jgi:hypothetical protein
MHVLVDSKTYLNRLSHMSLYLGVEANHLRGISAYFYMYGYYQKPMRDILILWY